MAQNEEAQPPAKILTYERIAAPPRRLSLRNEDGTVVVSFPAPPKWMPILSISLQLAAGLIKLGTAIAIVVAVHRVAWTGPAPSPEVAAQIERFELFVLGSGALSAVFWWGAAICTWWAYRHGAGDPKTLLADSKSLVFRRYRWVRRCQTVWPVENIDTVELRMVKGNLNWTRTVADLCVRLRKGGRKRFRLSSPDPMLAGRIAQSLSAALGVPLSVG